MGIKGYCSLERTNVQRFFVEFHCFSSTDCKDSLRADNILAPTLKRELTNQDARAPHLSGAGVW
jgi:hypothetical protein